MSSGDQTVVLWFNARCSKARRARELLEAKGVPLRVVSYLDEPPTREQLDAILQRLGREDDPRAIVRTKEAIYAELGLASADDDTLLDAVCAHPVLLERPIVVRGDRAVVARPPEELETLF